MREKVITHLMIIHAWAECAREREQFFSTKHLEGIAEWTDDAIALLKEHDKEVKAAYRRGLESGRTIKWD